MTTMTRQNLYAIARAAANGGAFKIEFPDRAMALAFLIAIGGMPSVVWQPFASDTSNYIERWEMGDGYTATIGLRGLVVFKKEAA